MVTEQGTIPPSGKRQKTPAAFIFDYENGKLKGSRHYFGMLSLLKQIGAASTEPESTARRGRWIQAQTSTRSRQAEEDL